MKNTEKLIAFLEKQTYIDKMTDFLIRFNDKTLQLILSKLDPNYTPPKRKLKFTQRQTIKKKLLNPISVFKKFGKF